MRYPWSFSFRFSTIQLVRKEDTEHFITTRSVEPRNQFLVRNTENESGGRKMKKIKRRGEEKKTGRGLGLSDVLGLVELA